jgi:hypothetical protein
MPPVLTPLFSNLALALGHAFCCRKMCTEDQSNKKYQSLVWLHCTKAQRALRQLEVRSSGPRAALTVSHFIRGYGELFICCSEYQSPGKLQHY